MKEIASPRAKCFLHSILSYSNKYFSDDIKTSQKEIVAQKFWDCVYAKTKWAFDEILKEMKKINKDAAKYISNLSQDWLVPYVIKSLSYS